MHQINYNLVFESLVDGKEHIIRLQRRKSVFECISCDYTSLSGSNLRNSHFRNCVGMQDYMAQHKLTFDLSSRNGNSKRRA